MTALVSLIPIIAAASGAVAGTAQLLAGVRTAKRQREDLKRLNEETQTKAIGSADLEVLGKYLYDEIGPVRIGDVASDAQVRSRTLRAFAELTRFVGEESPPDAGEPPLAPMATGVPSPAELEESRRQILSGQVWNGLALMRRHLELTLRESDPQLASARMGAGQLLAAAERTGSLPREVIPQLRYAVSVANKAIHGEDVDVNVALEAVAAADHGLRSVQAHGESNATSD